MIALAGILSVMLIASCTKEVEIEGDADVANVDWQNYQYRLKASGTVKYPVYDEESGKYVQKTATLKSDDSSCGGWLSYNKDSNRHSNYKRYGLNVWSGDGDMSLESRSLIGDKVTIIEHDGSYYFEKADEKYKAEGTSNPESESFTVKGTWEGWVNNYSSNSSKQKIEFDLTLTR